MHSHCSLGAANIDSPFGLVTLEMDGVKVDAALGGASELSDASAGRWPIRARAVFTRALGAAHASERSQQPSGAQPCDGDDQDKAPATTTTQTIMAMF